MKDKKGFTLIELLAVIVILAIIAIIAVPIILNVIEESRRGAFKNSVHGVIKAAEFYLVNDLEGRDDYTFYFPAINKKLSYKGSEIIGGSIEFSKTDIQIENISDGKYCANGVLENIEITTGDCSNAPSDAELATEVVEIGDYISYDAGKWNYSKPISEIGYWEFGGNIENTSKETGINCETGEQSGSDGWRVVSKNGHIKIIHAGTPECYSATYNKADYNLPKILNKAYGAYLNPDLADSAGPLTYELAKELNNGSLTYASTITSPSVLLAGAKYWVPAVAPNNASHLIEIRANGYISSFGAAIYGIRPVVDLKETVYITSGDGSKENPYIIKNYEKSEEINSYLVGYWTNWNALHADPSEDVGVNMKLRDVPNYYDIVALGFGYTLDGSPQGTIDFELDPTLSNRLSYTDQELIEDISILQNRNQKVILSIGAVPDITEVKLETQEDINNFVESIRNLKNKYNFDGIDLDFETEVNIPNLKMAILELKELYGDDFIITWIVQTTDISIDRYGNYQGRFVDILLELQDEIDLISISNYNVGSQYGFDWKVYEPGTVDYIVNTVSVLIEKGLKENKVGFAISTLNTQVGNSDISTVLKAYNMLTTGRTDSNATIILPRAYKKLGGITVWNINMDEFLNRSYGPSLGNGIR